MLQNIQELNKLLLNYFNSFADNESIKQVIFIFADAPIFFLPIFLVWYWIYHTYKSNSEKNKEEKKSDLLFILYWVVFSLIISMTIQQFVNIDRPEQHLINASNLLLNHIPDASFPSDHATVSFAFVTWLFLTWYKKIGYTFIIFAVIMNISRVIAWVHWPFDILAWALVWSVWICIVFKQFKKNKYILSFNNWIIKMMWFLKL